MCQSADKVKYPGLRTVADSDGDSQALLATTATIGAFPCWPAAMMAARRDVQLINVVSKLGRTHIEY